MIYVKISGIFLINIIKTNSRTPPTVRLFTKKIGTVQKVNRPNCESGRKDSDVYTASNASKQTFSKIRSDKKYHPKKNTVLAFAVGLKLTLEETEDLLKSAEYALSRSDMADIIVSYCIANKYYDIYEINEVLYDHDQSLLGIDKKSTVD